MRARTKFFFFSSIPIILLCLCIFSERNWWYYKVVMLWTHTCTQYVFSLLLFGSLISTANFEPTLRSGENRQVISINKSPHSFAPTREKSEGINVCVIHSLFFCTKKSAHTVQCRGGRKTTQPPLSSTLIFSGYIFLTRTIFFLAETSIIYIFFLLCNHHHHYHQNKWRRTHSTTQIKKYILAVFFLIIKERWKRTM